MADAVNAYVRMIRGSRGVIDDIEAQRRIDLPTNSLHLPPIPLARLPAIQPVPEYQGKTARFLMVSFAGFKNNRVRSRGVTPLLNLETHMLTIS
jgi:hypothetical protein